MRNGVFILCDGADTVVLSKSGRLWLKIILAFLLIITIIIIRRIIRRLLATEVSLCVWKTRQQNLRESTRMI